MGLAIVTGAAREGANRTHSHSRISCGVTCASPVAACVVTGHVPWNGTVPVAAIPCGTGATKHLGALGCSGDRSAIETHSHAELRTYRRRLPGTRVPALRVPSGVARVASGRRLSHGSWFVRSNSFR